VAPYLAPSVLPRNDEPLGVADVFTVQADADGDAELIEAAGAAGFTVVDA
jgi:hypothetical protein